MPSHGVVTLVPGTPEYVEVLDFLRSAASGGDTESEKMLQALAKGRCSLRSERLAEKGKWTCPAGVTNVVQQVETAEDGTPISMTLVWVQPVVD